MFATKEMNVTSATIIKDVYVAPQGKAAVLQDTFLELLKEADSLMKYSKTTKTRGDDPHSVKLGDKSRYITLETSFEPGESGQITGEIWTKSGEYIALKTIVKARVERPFRIAVDLEVLKLTVAIANKNERIDMVINVETNTLSLMQNAQDRYGNTRIGWRSSFKGLPSIEMQEPVDSHPAPDYTKEQKAEFKWLGKAAAKNDNRPVLMFAHAETVNGQTFVATADGYRAHYTTSQHIQGLDGFIDINNIGEPDGRFPDVGYIASHVTGQKVNVYYGDLLKAVKAAMKVIDGKEKIVTFEFKGNVLTVTGKSHERGNAEAHLLCSKAKDGQFTVNGQYILDALAGCDGIPNKHDPNKQHTVMIQFNEPKQPIRIVPHPGRLAVIMPAKDNR